MRRGDGKDCALLSSEGVGGEVGVPRNLFPRRGLGNLPSEGTGVRGFPAGQSSRKDQCIGTGPF